MPTKEKTKYELKENFVDASSMITLTMPLNSAIELFGADMSTAISLKSRGYNLALSYGGLTRVIKLRDYTKRRFNIDTGSGVVRTAHDALYGIVLGPVIKTGIYLSAGETDLEKMAVGVIGTMIASGSLAVPIGWMIDVGRDLWGIKPSVRTPKILKDKSSKFKKTVAAGALAASFAVTGLLYGINYLRDGWNNQQNSNTSGIEKVVQEVELR